MKSIIPNLLLIQKLLVIDFSIAEVFHKYELDYPFRAEFICNIDDFHPFADGFTPDDNALLAALTKCKNGGTIYFPEGNYLLSPFNVSSDTELYLDYGAVILANNNFSAWPIVQPLPSYPDDFHGGRVGPFIGICLYTTFFCC